MILKMVLKKIIIQNIISKCILSAKSYHLLSLLLLLSLYIMIIILSVYCWRVRRLLLERDMTLLGNANSNDLGKVIHIYLQLDYFTYYFS
jgi:hypothetical protein